MVGVPLAGTHRHEGKDNCAALPPPGRPPGPPLPYTPRLCEPYLVRTSVACMGGAALATALENALTFMPMGVPLAGTLGAAGRLPHANSLPLYIPSNGFPCYRLLQAV